MKIKFTLLLILSIFLFSGCTSIIEKLNGFFNSGDQNNIGIATQEEIQNTEQNIDDAYPVPSVVTNEPYPAPSLLKTEPYPNVLTTSEPYTSPDQNNSNQNGSTDDNSIDQDSTSNVDVTMKVSDPETVQLSSGNYLFIEFFAYWDPTSKSMAPIINELEAKFSNKIKFVFLDIDDKENESFKQTLKFSGPPQFYLLNGKGEIVQQWMGMIASDQLESAFKSIE